MIRKISKKSVVVTVCCIGALGLASGCTSPGKKTAIGAGAGAAVGAAVGGATGGGKGAVRGGVIGGVMGAAIGNYLDRQAKELAEVAETHRTAEGILVNLKQDLLFEFAKSDLKPQAVSQLQKLGGILAKYPEDHIRILGYTDSIGAPEFNLKLSNERAQAVEDVLLAQGVKPEQIQTLGKGETNPIASNATSDGRAQNRRVEVRISIPREKMAAVAEKEKRAS